MRDEGGEGPRESLRERGRTIEKLIVYKGNSEWKKRYVFSVCRNLLAI